MQFFGGPYLAFPTGYLAVFSDTNRREIFTLIGFGLKFIRINILIKSIFNYHDENLAIRKSYILCFCVFQI